MNEKKRKKNWTIWIIVMLGTCGAATSAFGLEKTVAPVSSTVKATPLIASMEGSIGALDVKSQTPSLRLILTGGRSRSLELDRATTVWKDRQALTLDRLKVGDRVKIRHMTKNGRQMAKSIEIL